MRFFLFDKNVKEEGGGHIFPWDIQILVAAKKKGFDTFFVVSEDFAENPQNVTVIKAYSVSKINNMLSTYRNIAQRFHFIIRIKKIIKFFLRMFYIKYREFEQQINGYCGTPTYRDETENVYKEWQITKDDFVLFNFISAGELRDIKNFYQTLEKEQIPNTCFYLSEVGSNLLRRTDEDYNFSKSDNELKEVLSYFFTLNSKLCAIPDYKSYFESILNESKRIIDVQLMSFGGISREKIAEARNNIEKRSVLQIGTLGSFDEKHGADVMGQMLPSIVKKIIEKGYKIKFNIKTEKNYETISNLDAYRNIKKLPEQYLFCTDNETMFSAEEYFQRLKAQDIIFLPYNNFFKYAVSGVLCEAYELGKPVIVSAGNGLARTIKSEQFEYLKKVEIIKQFNMRASSPKMTVNGKKEQPLLFAQNLSDKHYALLNMSSSVPGGRIRRETSVSIFIYELDKNGVCLRRRERLIESNDNREFKTLIKLMDETDRLVINVSNADTIYEISLSDVEILFSEDEDIRLGVIGLDFTTEENLLEAIEEIYLNYDHYRETARTHGEKWSKEHSAERMLDSWMLNY